MFAIVKFIKFFLLLFPIFLFNSIAVAENEEVYLEAISDQIQVITKDLKTLEKAVYQKSDITTSNTLSSIKSDGLNEDIMTKHLLKLNEIENQFRKLTNKFEDFNQWKLVFKHKHLTEKSVRKLLDVSYKSYYLRFSWIKKYLINKFF